MDDHPAGHDYAGGGDQALGAIFIEGDGQGERVGAGVGDAEHLQHGGDAGLARPADALALGEVEDEVRRVGQESLQQLPAVAQLDRVMAQPPQHRGDALDGGRAIELLLKVVGQVRTLRTVRLQVVGDADPHPG